MGSSPEMDLLGTLVKRTEPKPSWYLTVSGINADINTNFSPPISLPNGCNYEIACCSVETFYSFPNIDRENNSFKISVDGGVKWSKLQVPVGCYEIKSINSTVKKLVEKQFEKKSKEICILPNRNTLKCEITLGKDVQIDFRGVDGSLRTVLGFDEKVYKGAGTFESEHVVHILRINSIFVHCDVVTLARKNGITSPVIYNFFPNVPPGYKIVSRPKNLIYIPLSLDVINRMRVWLTDQNDNLLDLRGEQLTVTFHLKAC